MHGARLKAVESEASDEEVEEQFTMQLEQLIKQCDDELGLIPKMAEWKPWDVPAGHKVWGPSLHNSIDCLPLHCSLTCMALQTTHAAAWACLSSSSCNHVWEHAHAWVLAGGRLVLWNACVRADMRSCLPRSRCLWRSMWTQ